MGRGRKTTTSELRVMIEVLLIPDRAVFVSEIAEHVDIGKERVRQLCGDLVEKGYLEKKSVSGRNLYRLTDDGYEHLAGELRQLID